MKMKKLGLLFMMLCMVFAVNAQELKKGDKLPDFHLKSAVYGDVSSAELKGKEVRSAILKALEDNNFFSGAKSFLITSP